MCQKMVKKCSLATIASSYIANLLKLFDKEDEMHHYLRFICRGIKFEDKMISLRDMNHPGWLSGSTCNISAAQSDLIGNF